MGRYQRVAKWMQIDDLKDKDAIVVPINQRCGAPRLRGRYCQTPAQSQSSRCRRSHWFVAVICFPGTAAERAGGRTAARSQAICLSGGKSPSTSPSACWGGADTDIATMACPAVATALYDDLPAHERPRILIFDSLNMRHDAVVKELQDYLTCLWASAGNGTPINFSEPGLLPRCRVTAKPAQSDHSNCGLFVLQFIERFLNDMCSARDRSGPTVPALTFVSDAIENMRGKIADIIRSLAEPQSAVNEVLPTSMDDSDDDSVWETELPGKRAPQ